MAVLKKKKKNSVSSQNKIIFLIHITVNPDTGLQNVYMSCVLFLKELLTSYNLFKKFYFFLYESDSTFLKNGCVLNE